MSEDRMDEFIDEFLSRFKKATGFDFATGKLSSCIKPEPQLIQGYTAENWQEIIDGGYLCEFKVGVNEGENIFGFLETTESGNFKRLHGGHFNVCRPAQIKGVIRPIFVEPVEEDVDVVFFDGNGFPIGDGSCISTEGVSYVWEAWHKKIKQRGATKYIEV